ncbi:MAG: hypothetical protein IRZ16_23825 [Myxococcaceae bacterium]|nr:hypothetical protein [Myxococcaceae bacterium]
MSRRLWPLLFGTALLSASARADETQTLPRGVFLLDVQYAQSTLDKQWDGEGHAQPLIADVVRYEPGGGLQGILTAHPVVRFDWLITQLLYGVTDELTVGALLPVSLRTRIDTNLGWTPGEYQPQLGRPYSQEDFWQWAESMGQPRPAAVWEGNRGAPADLVLLARWRFQPPAFLERIGVTPAATLMLALPTGRNADPEELVAAGTNGWEIHSYGDAEAHLSAKKALFTDTGGLERATLSADVFFAWLRPRTFETPTGARNPLLLTYQPYVGDTYVIDGGDWLGGTLTIDLALLAGPTHATRVSNGDLAQAQKLPALISLNASYTYVATGQTWWRSDSALWDYDREEAWQPGEKHIFRINGFVSFMRLGVPLQLYATYRTQELIPGRFTRPSSVLGGGARVLARFW